MRSKIEPILEGHVQGEVPKNMLDAEKYLAKFENIEELLRETVDRSRMSFVVEDIMKCIELLCDRFQIIFASIDDRGRLIFRDNEYTHKLYVSLLCYREESIKAVKEMMENKD